MAVQPRLENLSSDPSLRKTGSTRLTPSPIALLKRGEGKKIEGMGREGKRGKGGKEKGSGRKGR